eukprot:c9888_g1_i1 orf=232-1602(+)
MASARHRPLPSSSSSARNPFDSSDDEDEGKKSVPSIASSSRRDYSNPFDDEYGRAEASTGKPSDASGRPRSKKPQAEAYANNPFDDDGDYGAREVRAPSLKAKLDQGTLFDEQPRFHGDLSTQEPKSKIKPPANSALKKVQKFKDAGASQASKIVEGGLHQAQRLKESSFNAFKPSEGASEVKQGKPAVSGHARSQLFAEDARPSAFNKGGHGVYDKGQGLYETGSLGIPPCAVTRYDDHQFQGADLEQKSVQELEGYAVQKSEDTTKRIQNCLKVAEDIKGDATRTLISLHEQGEQMRRTHELAHDIDQNLTAGEKLLGSLGGMFSRTWKPRKGPTIKGPIDDPNDYEIRRKGHHLEQRTALGLNAKGRMERPSHSVPDSHLQTTQGKLEMEKTKQDDALSDLSNVLDQLKDMSMDMGSEIARQNVSLDHFQNDVVSLDERVKGANVRGRRLLGK